MRTICSSILLIVLLSFSGLYAQNYIGLSKSEIARAMASDHPNFKFDNSTVNDRYRYMKYVDKISEQTLLFFLSGENECTYVRHMADYSNINDIVSSLDEKYVKKGKNIWKYKKNRERYTITLEEGDWYFTVHYRKDN